MDHEVHERGERRERRLAPFTPQAVCGEQHCIEFLIGVWVQAAELERLEAGLAAELELLSGAMLRQC